MEPSDCLYLRPAEIHYSQDTISAVFHDGRKIGDTLDALVAMETFVTDIPPITVVKYEDKHFTRNNRRLWVFRQLHRMGQCECIPTILSSELPSNQFTTDTDGYEIIVRGEDGSSTLRDFEKLQRDQTVQTLKALRLGPITPSFRCNRTPRFRARRRQDYRKQGHVAARRNILRGKRRCSPTSRDPGYTEQKGFDFDQYNVSNARIAFTEQREMVFGSVEGSEHYGTTQNDYQPSKRRRYEHGNGPMSNVSRRNGCDDYRSTEMGRFDQCGQSDSVYSIETVTKGPRVNSHTGYRQPMAGEFSYGQPPRASNDQWSNEYGLGGNRMSKYHERSKAFSRKRNLHGMLLRVYGDMPQEEDFAFNRFDSRH